MPDDTRFRFFILTCRDARTDFRWPLSEALRAYGEVYYIWLRRRPIVTGADGKSCEMSAAAFLLFMARLRQGEVVNVYVNSTNTSFPLLTTFLKYVAPAGIWCLDMHDDLRYHFRGMKRLHAILAIKIMRCFSDLTFHAAHTLVELFPDSHHLGNASQIQRLNRPEGGANEVLVIASFDGRFDFDLMAHVAARCASTSFHIYGRTPVYAPSIVRQLDDLTAQHENVVYRGAYDLDALPKILAAYHVSFAPYRANSILTRYIDPLRYYHCLNSGMEVMTTAHPQALAMQDVLHIVHDAEEFAATLDAISKTGFSKLAGYAPITWQQRAEQLIALLQDLPTTKQLHVGIRLTARA